MPPLHCIAALVAAAVVLTSAQTCEDATNCEMCQLTRFCGWCSSGGCSATCPETTCPTPFSTSPTLATIAPQFASALGFFGLAVVLAALLAVYTLTPLEALLSRSASAAGSSAPAGLAATLGVWGSPTALVVAATLLWLGSSLVFAAPLLPWVAVLFNDPAGLELPLVSSVDFFGVRTCSPPPGSFPTGIAGLTDCSTGSLSALANSVPDAPSVASYATSGQAGATFVYLILTLCLLPAATTLSLAAYRLARLLRCGAPVHIAGLSAVNVQVAGVCAAVGAFASSCVWWGAIGTSHQFNVGLCGRLFGSTGGACTDASSASLPGTAAFGLAFLFNFSGAALALWASRYLGGVPGMTGLHPCSSSGATSASAWTPQAPVDAPFYAASGNAGGAASAGEYVAPLIYASDSSETSAAVLA